MRGLLKVYQKLLQKHPFACQSLQAGLLMGTGDVIAQTLVEKKPVSKLNYVRTVQFFGLGTVLVGPALTVWYRVLSKQFGDTGKSAVLKKVACDQLCFAPTFIVVFLSSLGYVQGRSLTQIQTEIRRNYLDILLSNYKIWPAVQLANFYIVPLQYQVLVVQVVALVWNAYLSWKTQTSHAASP